MNMIIQNFYMQNSQIFCANKINITKEQILALRDQGKKEKEIQAILGLSLRGYYSLLKMLSVPGVISALNQKLASIPKNEFEQMLKDKATMEDICKKYKISASVYYTYIEKNNLKNYITYPKKKSVTKDMLQELVDKKYSIDEICKKLSIAKDTYFRLLKKFDILTEYKKNKANAKNITKEQIVSLLDCNKKISEICEELNISASTLRKLFVNFNINTRTIQSKKIISTITKEQLLEYIEAGVPSEQICKELNLSKRTYSRLTNKFGINTPIRQAKANIKNVTKEQLQRLVDEGLTMSEICKKLHLSGKSIFYRLLKTLDIRYNYKNHSNEINIPREDLQKAVDEWKSVRDIEEKLHVSNSTFYNKIKSANIKSVLSNSIETIDKLNKNDIQEKLDKGASPKEICDMYNITPRMYNTLIAQYGLLSQGKKNFQRVKSITKEQIELLVNSGRNTKEICEELNITIVTYIKLIKKFNIERKNK